MSEFSTSISSQHVFAEFETRSGRHVEAAERYGCPVVFSENVLFC